MFRLYLGRFSLSENVFRSKSGSLKCRETKDRKCMMSNLETF